MMSLGGARRQKLEGQTLTRADSLTHFPGNDSAGMTSAGGVLPLATQAARHHLIASLLRELGAEEVVFLFRSCSTCFSLNTSPVRVLRCLDSVVGAPD